MIATGGISRAPAQGTVSGSIVGIAVDERKGAVSGVEIRVGDRMVLTGPDGRFAIDSLGRGPHHFTARKLGYAPESLSVNLDPRRVDTLQFMMHESATTLDRLDVVDNPVVSARLEGFEHRRERKNGGQFVTRADIERRMPQVTSDIMRRLQGLRIVDSLGVQLAISTRGPKPTLTGRGASSNAACVLRVGVDGLIKEPYFPMNTIPVADIHGVEVYSGPSTLPPEFGGARQDAGCGLIMIWTRAR